MKLTYVSHASLLLQSSDATVITDPWFNGPAYHNQWHVFPKPVDVSFASSVSHILLTHAHEDHFHPPTLQLMNKDAKVYFPYTWKSGMVEQLKSIGFKNIVEVKSNKKVQITKDLCATFIVNGLDAFVVYEFAGMAILNLNDSLNASHKHFLHLFTNIIKANFPAIDLMICGLGGASYFPNTVHSPLKNDHEIAQLREQFLAHKFCELVDAIKPKSVVPFVPGFALLEKDKQWINEMKFSRQLLPQYYKDNFDATSKINFYNMLPGDVVENNAWLKTSPYHKLTQNDNLSHLVQEQYAAETEVANRVHTQPSYVAYSLAEKLNEILHISRSGISNQLLKQINFGIHLLDIPADVFIHCYHNGSKLVAKAVEKWPTSATLKISTHTWKLNYALTEEWGGDVFFIGYGADIDILDHSCLQHNLDIISIRLLSRFPAASHAMLHQPVRAFKYLLNNPAYLSLAIKQKFIAGGNPNKLPYNERSHWINKSKCDVCRLCNIPLLSDEFGEHLSLQTLALTT